MEAEVGLMSFEEGGRGLKPLEAEKRKAMDLPSELPKGTSLAITLLLVPSP